MRSLLFILLFTWLTLGAQGPLSAQGSQAFATDLVALEGPWEFYWQSFLSEETAARTPDAIMPHILPWNRIHLPRRAELPSFGYATYRMVIPKLPAAREAYLLVPGGHYGAQRILVRALTDKRVLGEHSIGSPSKVQTTPFGAFGSLLFHMEKTEDVEILIETSNHSYYKGGIVVTPKLGLGAQAEHKRLVAPLIDVTVLGILISMFLFNLIFWIYHKEFVSFLLASSIFVVILRTLTVSSILFQFVPENYYSWVHLLEYITVACFPIFTVYLDLVFPSKTWVRSSVRIHFYANSLCSLILCFLPAYYYTKYLWTLQLSALIVLNFGIIITFFALRSGARGSYVNFVGFSIIALGGCNDLFLVSILRVWDIFLTPWCMAVYVILQSQIVAKRLADASRLALSLAEEKSEYQTALRLETEARFQMASDAAHHLNNPLNYIHTHLDAMTLSGRSLQTAVGELLGPYPSEEPDVRHCQEQFQSEFAELFAPIEGAKRGVHLAGATVAKIRALSGIDGYGRDRLILQEKLVALQNHMRLVLDASSFARIHWQEVNDPKASFIGNPHVFRFLIEQLITRCLNASSASFEVNFRTKEANEDGAISVQVSLHHIFTPDKFSDLELKFQQLCKPFQIDCRLTYLATQIHLTHVPKENSSRENP